MDSEPQTCPNPEITPEDWRRTPSSVQQMILHQPPVNGCEYRTFRRYPQAFKRNMPTFPEKSVLMRPRPIIQALLLCSFVSFSAVADDDDDDDDDSGVPRFISRAPFCIRSMTGSQMTC
jgi:hypothetical protein